MKDRMMTVAAVGVLIVALLEMAAASPGYWPLPQDSYNLQEGGAHATDLKRGFWDKRNALHFDPTDVNEAYPNQWLEGRLPQKRGFGTMMPVYLMHLYRPEQPVLPSTAILSSGRPGWDRLKTINIPISQG